MERPESPAASWVPETEAERRAIREQMERLLANPLFRNSRRYPSLFRFVVEKTLEGHTDQLKERTLGIEVFGRDPDYDTNSDPVVRATAGEIRKRIAQYYHEPGHESEVRIDLLPGSYIPEFRLPVENPAALPPRRSGRKRYISLSATASFVILAVSAAWLRPSPKALDRFWGPVLDSSASVLLCVGPPDRLKAVPLSPAAPDDSAPPITLYGLLTMQTQQVALADATTLARIAGLLQTRGKSYQIRSESATTFTDLRGTPVVLIGAFNNDWTMRVTAPLRFTFQMNLLAQHYWIQDRKAPARQDWGVNMSVPYQKLTKDYAIIARSLDPATERMMVVAGGVGQYGTIAAGEFLSNPRYLQATANQLPTGWERKNIEMVIETSVINGNSGPPRVIATTVW